MQCESDLGVLKNRRHPGSLQLPLLWIILNNAKTIYPQESYAERPYDLDGLSKC